MWVALCSMYYLRQAKSLSGTFPSAPSAFPPAFFQFSLAQNRRYFLSTINQKYFCDSFTEIRKVEVRRI